MDEQQFIEQLRNGDRGAFNRLVEEYKDVILNVCYGFVKNADEAEDLTQEVFVEVYKTITRFREQSSLYTWIYRIAVSKSLDTLKRKKSVKRAAFFEKRVRSDSADLEMEQTPSVVLNPEAALEQKQQRLFINHCLNQLAENQRVAFVLSQQNGMSYREIAEIMGKSLSSIESLVHRAKTNLRKIMEESYHDYF